MEIKEITSEEYLLFFNKSHHIFNSVQFNELNKYKCEKLLYLLFQEDKVKIGLIAGLKDGVLSSPFSAPYGGFSSYSDDLKIKYLDETLQLLDDYAKNNQINTIRFILPPYFYNENFLSKTFYSLLRDDYQILYTDVNFHFKTSDIKKYENNEVDRSALGNLRKANRAGLIFQQVFDAEGKFTVYDIIKQNKEKKGRPTHMSYEQLMNTGKIIDIDFFLVFDKDIPIASAIVYHVSYKIVQIIYWGDLPEYSANRPMNFLSFKLFEFYFKQGKNIVDLSISTVNGEPNYGLCDFKQNIGCTAGIKFTLEKNFNKTIDLFQMNYFIHKLADVNSKNIGKSTTIWQYTIVLEGAVIGENCNINNNCFIENDVIIGNNVTIKCGVYIWDGIRIDDYAFIGPNVTFTNDKYPRSKQNFNLQKTIVSKGATIGAGSVVLCGITIGEYAMIGAGSIVTKDILPYTLWFGNPAVQKGYITSEGEILDMNMVSKNGVKYQLVNNKLIAL